MVFDGYLGCVRARVCVCVCVPSCRWACFGALGVLGMPVFAHLNLARLETVRHQAITMTSQPHVCCTNWPLAIN